MTDALHAEISHTGCFRVQRIYTGLPAACPMPPHRYTARHSASDHKKSGLRLRFLEFYSVYFNFFCEICTAI